VFIMSLFFFVLMMLIRAQPEHYDTLDALLVPPAGCTMPCFLGIRIGETDAAEAIDILQTHPWIDSVEHMGAGDRQVSSIRFHWSPDAPRYVGSFRENILEVGYRTEEISAITLHLFVPTGDVWRFLNTRTVGGTRLASHIRVDGANCQNNPLSYYSAAPERLYYRAGGQPHPYVPMRERPRAFRC
jgi:hypothetical protein